MSLRRLLSQPIIGLFALVAASGFALAQADQDVPAVEDSANAFVGEINADAVYVRSGPADNYYPTMKLDKGVNVTVVGHKFGWLKIVPPEGSFSYVAKMHVTPAADGKSGRVDRDALNVRAGSSLNDIKTAVQTKLNTGDTVTIVGEVQEYYKIAAPKGTSLYVKEEFVNPVKKLTPDEAPKDVIAAGPVASEPIAAGETVAGSPNAGEVPPSPENPEAPAVTVTPTTQTVEPVAVEPAPATQPAEPSVTEQFDKLEADFQTLSQLALKDQPLPQAIADYDTLLASPQLPESMRRIAEARLATLKVRKEAMDQFAVAQQTSQQSEARTQALTAEKAELEERIRQNSQAYYTAVGTLQTSSLQKGPLILYRLTDPATGQTVVYIRTNDSAFAGMIGQFVGVRGPVTDDTQLQIRVITPDAVATVDPGQLGSVYSAEMVPQSVIARRAAVAPAAP